MTQTRAVIQKFNEFVKTTQIQEIIEEVVLPIQNQLDHKNDQLHRLQLRMDTQEKALAKVKEVAKAASMMKPLLNDTTRRLNDLSKTIELREDKIESHFNFMDARMSELK